MRRIFLVVKILWTLLRLLLLRDCTRKGQYLAASLPRLGPSFIKLGQTLSVRPDIVGVEIAEALSSLQDQLPPFRWSLVKKRIEAGLGGNLEDVFKTFEQTPVAAASIAQVHKAHLHDGTEVAVKILRPNIARRFQSDIAVFYVVARIVARFRRFRRLKPVAVVETFERTVKKELDLRIEAAAASELKSNTQKDEGIYVPRIYWDYTAQHVLTLEWIEGISIDDIAALKAAGHDPSRVSERLAIGFFNQAYRDGFFHADTHPGNLFVDAQGRIVPIDFGIMGRLDYQTRLYVAQIVHGFITGDYEAVAKVHFDAGYVSHDYELGDFVLACRAIGEPIIGLPANEISIAKLLALLFKITEDFEMETQPQLLLLQKTMMLVEGLGKQLDSQVNMWQQAEPWIEQWAKENLSLEAQFKQGVKKLGKSLFALPERVRQLEQILEAKTQETVVQPSRTSHKTPCRWTGIWVIALGTVVLWGVFG